VISEFPALLANLGDWRSLLLIGGAALLAAVVVGLAAYLLLRRRRPAPSPGEAVPMREHFRELRSRLMVCLVALLIGTAVAFYFYQEIFAVLLQPAKDVAAVDDFQPIYTDVTEFLGTTVRMSLLGGFVLALPVILYNAIRFVAPGLTPRERRILFSFLPVALLAFVGGMAFGYFVMIPPALRFLLTFGGDIAEPLIRISNLVNIMIRLLFWLGLSFETPLVMYILAVLGVVRASGFSRFRRLWLVASFVIAAAITPTIDPVNQAIVAVPLIVLYELGILLARFAGRRQTPPA
jgi:sec-independent protein translocase protein TatC